MEIRFRPIGVVYTKAGDDDVKVQGGQEGELEIFPEFADGLDGIDGYSHLFVLVYFDRLRPEQIGPLKVKPRGLLRRGFKLDDLPELGVFALDSPTRPNPIGLTLVQFIARDDNRLQVKGLDFLTARRSLPLHRMRLLRCRLRHDTDARRFCRRGGSEQDCPFPPRST
jgi:tRNA-Thr(GGU) m(6)t(6)A37 methyltransferase TsaA